MKKLFLLICMGILFTGCATVYNRADFDAVTMQPIEHTENEELGTVKVRRLAFLWTQLKPEEAKTEKMMQKLENKALKKYGENIKLVDIKIGGVAPIMTPAIWLCTAGYGFFVKGMDATAVVIKSEIPYQKGSYSLFASKEVEEKQEQIAEYEARHQFRTKHDEFQQTDFIKYSYFRNDSPISLYIGKRDTQKDLHVVFKYDGKDWIFFDNAILVNAEGQKIEFEFNSWDRKEDIGYNADVSEKFDEVLQEKKILELRTLLNGTGVKLRLAGKHDAMDYSLDKEYQEAIKDVIKKYDEL